MQINQFLRKILLIATCITLILNMSGCNIKFIVRNGNDLNLDGYELTFYDEFTENSLDTSIWEYKEVGQIRAHGNSLDEIIYKPCFNHPDQVQVNNGLLTIKGEYTTKEYGEGWHVASIELKKWYTYGYYEISCIPNNSESFWSAFWLLAQNPYSHEISQGGIYGSEIDVFETYKNHDLKTKYFITSTIHCNGFDEVVNKVDSERVVKAYVKNLYTEFTTFGMMWTEDEYIFYVNGVETGRTSFAKGTSRVPEKVIISLCSPENITLDKSKTTEFVVDYVKIYQKTNI